MFAHICGIYSLSGTDVAQEVEWVVVDCRVGGLISGVLKDGVQVSVRA